MVRDERGMTLTELLVVLAITALITGSLVTVMYQINRITGWGNDELVVQHDLQNAATWLNRDVAKARSAEVSDSQMTLVIPRFDDSTPGTINIYTNVITYTFSITDSTLTRDSGDSTLIVARHIISNPFPPADTINSTITITITSQAGDVTESAILYLGMRSAK